MKNIILLVCLVALLSGCATGYQAQQRKALDKSYDDKKITKEEYEKKLAKIEHDSLLAWERAKKIERKKKASHEFFALCSNCNSRFRFSELNCEDGGGYGNCPYCNTYQNLNEANSKSVNQARAMFQQAVMGQMINRAITPPQIPQYQPPPKPKITQTTGTITPMGLGTYRYDERTTSN